MKNDIRNNLILLKIHRKAITRFMEMMDDDWGTYTNEAGFKMAEHPFMKELMGVEHISVFSHPFNGGAKSFLAEMYKEISLAMLKDIDYYIGKLEYKEAEA